MRFTSFAKGVPKPSGTKFTRYELREVIVARINIGRIRKKVAMIKSLSGCILKQAHIYKTIHQTILKNADTVLFYRLANSH